MTREYVSLSHWGLFPVPLPNPSGPHPYQKRLPVPPRHIDDRV